MLRVIQESQGNIETMRRHEADERFSLLRKGNIFEIQTPKQRANIYCTWSPSYRSVKNSGGKMKACFRYESNCIKFSTSTAMIVCGILENKAASNFLHGLHLSVLFPT